MVPRVDIMSTTGVTDDNKRDIMYTFDFQRGNSKGGVIHFPVRSPFSE